VFVVGGGPSAGSLDLARLRGKRILAINDMSHRLLLLGVSTSVAAISLDNNWVRRNRDFLAAFPGEKFVALPLETWPECGGIEGVTYLKWGYGVGLSEDPAVINTGGNSGYGAINLAYLKGARRIFLIGFDMDPLSNPLHPQWARRFRTTVPQLAARGVEVWNLNPRTSIDAFPTIDAGSFDVEGAN
jgi:hypothetical protein